VSSLCVLRIILTAQTPLNNASKNGHLKIIKFLMKTHYDFNCEELIYKASENGHLEVVKFLAERLTNEDLINSKSLQKASKNGHFEVVKFLASRLTDDDLRNIYRYLFLTTFEDDIYSVIEEFFKENYIGFINETDESDYEYDLF
jgi:ankyrin repeat protein